MPVWLFTRGTCVSCSLHGGRACHALYTGDVPVWRRRGRLGCRRRGTRRAATRAPPRDTPPETAPAKQHSTRLGFGRLLTRTRPGFISDTASFRLGYSRLQTETRPAFDSDTDPPPPAPRPRDAVGTRRGGGAGRGGGDQVGVAEVREHRHLVQELLPQPAARAGGGGAVVERLGHHRQAPPHRPVHHTLHPRTHAHTHARTHAHTHTHTRTHTNKSHPPAARAWVC